MKKIGLLGAVFFLFGSLSANADIIHWTVPSIEFGDGAELAGEFAWDSDTNSVVDWVFELTDGTNPNFPAATFNTATSVAQTWVIGQSNQFLRFVHNSITNSAVIGRYARGLGIRLGFGMLDDLDTPSADLQLVGNSYAGRNGAAICYNCSPYMINTGRTSIKATAVPEPGTLTLFGLGLLGLGIARRNKT